MRCGRYLTMPIENGVGLGAIKITDWRAWCRNIPGPAVQGGQAISRARSNQTRFLLSMRAGREMTKSKTTTDRRFFGIRSVIDSSSAIRHLNVRHSNCRCATPRFDEPFLSVRGYG